MHACQVSLTVGLGRRRRRRRRRRPREAAEAGHQAGQERESHGWRLRRGPGAAPPRRPELQLPPRVPIPPTPPLGGFLLPPHSDDAHPKPKHEVPAGIRHGLPQAEPQLHPSCQCQGPVMEPSGRDGPAGLYSRAAAGARRKESPGPGPRPRPSSLLPGAFPPE